MGIAAPQLARSGDRLPIDVFIVSPNPRIRQALQEKLGPPRWNVTEARSGTGALELLYKGGADDSVLLLDPMLPDFAVNLGGSTSIDITKPGIDKAYGIRKLRDVLKIEIAEMLYVGDALFPGGNDYPARTTGATCIQVRDPNETKRVIEAIIGCMQ